MIQNILDRKGTEVFTIRATDTIQSAADRMRQHGIASLVVKSGALAIQPVYATGGNAPRAGASGTAIRRRNQ
jgi:CBS domain-containing protein